jgi:hypothetical protein
MGEEEKEDPVNSAISAITTGLTWSLENSTRRPLSTADLPGASVAFSKSVLHKNLFRPLRTKALCLFHLAETAKLDKRHQQKRYTRQRER